MSDWYFGNLVLIQGTMTTLLLALSIQLPMRAGVFSMAGIGAYGLGSYGTAIAVTKYGWSTWPALIAGTIVAGLVCYVLGVVVQRLTGLYLAMSTIAFDLVIVVLAGNGGDFTGGHLGIYGVIGDLAMWQIFVIVLLVIAAMAWSESGPMGRRVETVRDDPELATSMGIHVAAYRRSVFLISGLLAGLGGAINVLLRSTVQPDAVGFHLVVVALTIIIVGGSRSWIGALIGTIIFVWLPVFLTVVGEWRGVVYGLIVAAAAIYLPTGIVGVAQNLYRRYRGRGRTEAITVDETDETNEVWPSSDQLGGESVQRISAEGGNER